jgi:hypothetical protein
MSTTTTHTCGTCGALLNPNRVQRHLDWHENHDKLVARLAKRADRPAHRGAGRGDGRVSTCTVLRTADAEPGQAGAGGLATCGRPLAGTTICRPCTADLRRWLERVPSLSGDLLVTLTRQDRVAVPQPGGSGEAPLPFHVRASEALDDLQRVLGFWAQEVTGLRPTTPSRAAQRLLGALQVVVVHPEAATVVEAVRDVVTEGTEAVDHPRVLLWLGVCHAAVYDVHTTDVVGECLGDLYATADDTAVVCRACGARHDARDRRWALLASARRHELNATALAKACRAYGVTTTPSVVRNLAARDQLTPAGTDAAGHPTYRVGDVLDVLRERLERDRAQRENDTHRRTA